MNNLLEYGVLSETPILLPLQLHYVDWQASFPGRVVLLVITLIYKHGDHKPPCPFHGAQYIKGNWYNYECYAPGPTF